MAFDDNFKIIIYLPCSIVVLLPFLFCLCYQMVAKLSFHQHCVYSYTLLPIIFAAQNPRSKFAALPPLAFSFLLLIFHLNFFAVLLSSIYFCPSQPIIILFLRFAFVYRRNTAGSPCTNYVIDIVFVHSFVCLSLSCMQQTSCISSPCTDKWREVGAAWLNMDAYNKTPCHSIIRIEGCKSIFFTL